MFAKQLKILRGILAVSILALSLMAFAPAGPAVAAAAQRPGGPGTGLALTPLSAAEKDALNQAVLEEYGMLNLYQSVLATFGNVSPFAVIASAEQQHITALAKQAAKYGVTLPTNPGLATPPTFAALSAACQAGVAAETADVALYDLLKPALTHSDLLRVFTNLQSAALNNHLPAFQACQ